MPSAAERVAARMAVVLLTLPALQNRVYRDRVDALTVEESPSCIVELVEEDMDPMGAGPLGAQLLAATSRVAVTFVVRNTASWQTEIDALRCAAHKLLMADAQLRSLVRSLLPHRAEWSAEEADRTLGYLVQYYRFKTLNPVGDFESAA